MKDYLLLLKWSIGEIKTPKYGRVALVASAVFNMLAFAFVLLFFHSPVALINIFFAVLNCVVLYVVSRKGGADDAPRGLRQRGLRAGALTGQAGGTSVSAGPGPSHPGGALALTGESPSTVEVTDQALVGR